MKAKLDKTKYLKDLYVKMMATVTAQRDVAWQREDQLQLEKLELAHHLDTVNDLAMQYRDVAFDLSSAPSTSRRRRDGYGWRVGGRWGTRPRPQ